MLRLRRLLKSTESKYSTSLTGAACCATTKIRIFKDKSAVNSLFQRGLVKFVSAMVDDGADGPNPPYITQYAIFYQTVLTLNYADFKIVQLLIYGEQQSD